MAERNGDNETGELAMAEVISEQEAMEAALIVRSKPTIANRYDNAANLLSRFIIQELASDDWQDEPSGDGWYWLEHSKSRPYKVAKRDYCGSDDETYDPGWKYEAGNEWWSLDCRVCKINDRPS